MWWLFCICPNIFRYEKWHWTTPPTPPRLLPPLSGTPCLQLFFLARLYKSGGSHGRGLHLVIMVECTSSVTYLRAELASKVCTWLMCIFLFICAEICKELAELYETLMRRVVIYNIALYWNGTQCVIIPILRAQTKSASPKWIAVLFGKWLHMDLLWVMVFK